MRLIDPQTGRPYVEKRLQRYNEAGEPRELTFSCYQRYPFLSRDRTREWFREALETARSKFNFQVWAYVLMPEHVHLLVVPGKGNVSDNEGFPRPSQTQGVPPNGSPCDGKNRVVASNHDEMSRLLQAVKEPVARKAIAYLKATASVWLPRLVVREGKRIRHRFWQPGGGYDRNVTEPATLRAMIEYIHANPVRRGLVTKAEDWEWSSARWFADMRPVKIEMDWDVLVELQRG